MSESRDCQCYTGFPMERVCHQCQSSFTISDRDEKFYEKMKVVEPTLCPDCGLQRRYAWRNEFTFYFRKCDLTGREMLSIYPPDCPYKVYHHEAWFSDKWNALDYGRDFDFSRPFFEQFLEVLGRFFSTSSSMGAGKSL